MDPITQQQLLTIGGAAEGEYIDNVFKTSSYAGTTEEFPVTNGIALGSGNAGRSVLFNAANYDYIGIPSHADLAIGTDDFTIEAWVYHVGAFPSYAGIFGPWTGTGDNSFILEAVGSGSTSDLEFYYYDTGGSSTMAQGAAMTKNQWHHVAVCRAANTIRVFVDGVMYGSGSSDSTNIRQGSSIATIGGHVAGTGGNWNGYISNLRYVKGQGLYTANFTPSTEALTTTSQGATASNVKLLCCNQTTVTGYDKSFGTLTRGTNQADGQGGPNPREYGPFTAAPTTNNSGGLVWLKNRDDNNTKNIWYDTVRGRTKYISTNDTGVETTVGNAANGLRSFDNSGFSMGDNIESLNKNAEDVVAWTFRKQKNFFDIVTWTGNTDTDQVVSHSLGSAPGFIVCKNLNGGTFFTYHRECGDTKHLRLNNAAAEATTGGGGSWSVGASSFTAPGSLSLNDDGNSYIAYIFAHDAGGFGEDGTNNAIQCGSYIGNGQGSGGPMIPIGWQPQWIMTKGVDGSGASSTNWVITDTLRGWKGADDQLLDADQQIAEYANVQTGWLRGNGVKISSTYQNTSGVKYVYVAIRASDGIVGKLPATGEDAFQATFGNAQGYSTSQAWTTQGTWDPDWAIRKLYTAVNQAGSIYLSGARIRFLRELQVDDSTGGAAAEGSGPTFMWDKNIPYGGFGDGSSFNQHYESWMWKKGPGCDTLTYKGNGASWPSTNTITHNLGGIPEMIITKSLSGGSNSGSGHWGVYHSGLSGNNYQVWLNRYFAESSDAAGNWNPTATTFNPFNDPTPASSANVNDCEYLAVLFRSVEGISKVGTYTGQATDYDLDLGFTPRFFMVKNISTSTEYITNWAFWDNRRGIATGNDSYLTMNVKNRNTVGFNLVDPIANGLKIKSVADKGTNPNNGTNWSGNVICNSGSFDFPISRSFYGAYPIQGPDAIWDSIPFSRTSGNYITISFNTDVNITIDAGQNFTVYTAEDSTATCVINGSTQTSNSGRVHEFAGPGTVTNFSARGNSTQGRTYFNGISVNGWLLRDNCAGATCGGPEMTNKTGDKYIYYAHA